MSTLKILSQEHKEVLEKLSLLGITIQGIETGKVSLLRRKLSKDASKTIQEISEFFRKDVGFHFEIEETVLFPSLEREVGTEREFISSLIEEHKRIREMITEFQNFAGLELKDENIKSKLIALSKEIIDKLSAHAKKEDEKLLPLAQKALDEQKLKEIDGIVRKMMRK